MKINHKQKRSFRVSIPVIALTILLIFFIYGCNNPTGGGSGWSGITPPIFTDPAAKVTELSTSEFSTRLISEAKTLDRNLIKPGTQVFMGYWSLYPNRGYLMNVLGAINDPSSSTVEANKAIWDEGVTTFEASRYPSYIRMNDEFWYERAYPVSGEVTITIEGVTRQYVDPHPVTTVEADLIWGTYSQRYADMASEIRRETGLTPEAICFVQGAKSNRIFYSFELPELVSLEAVGDVIVKFALTSEADWRNPADWAVGTVNAPTPEAP